jgi:hypothetical protein
MDLPPGGDYDARRIMRPIRFATILTILFLAACNSSGAQAPLPDIGKNNGPALTPPDSAGILILPVTGALPPAAAASAGAAMADALQKADVPASTTASNKGSYHLAGNATAFTAGDGDIAVIVTWNLYDAEGKKLGSAEGNASGSADAWRQGGGDLAQALANTAAPRISALVESGLPLPKGNINPVITLSPVTGAPGDGDASLARAMGAALQRVKIDLAEDQPTAKPDFTLTGTVEVSPPNGQNQQVKVSWALLRPDGSEVGRVNQENAVPAGSLDRAWGDIAYAVTNAAAPGVRQLILEGRNAAPGNS